MQIYYYTTSSLSIIDQILSKNIYTYWMKNYKIICLLINPKHMEETLLADVRNKMYGDL